MHAAKRKQVACNTFLKSDYRLDILTFTAPRYVQPASAAKAISNQLSPCPLPLSRSLVPVESYISFSSSLPWRSPCSESTFARSVCRRCARRRSTQAEQNPVRRKRQIKMDRPIISLTVHGRTRAAYLSSLQFNESRYTLCGKSRSKARRASSPPGSLVVTSYVSFSIVMYPNRNYLTGPSISMSSTLTSWRPVFLWVNLRQGLRRVQMGRPTDDRDRQRRGRAGRRAGAESGITK